MPATVRDVVVATIREVLASRGRDAAGGDLSDGQRLFAAGLGLDSLDFATVVVRLEQQIGLDPFRTGRVNHPPTTVGELVAVYEAEAGQSNQAPRA